MLLALAARIGSGKGIQWDGIGCMDGCDEEEREAHVNARSIRDNSLIMNG